MKVLRLKTHHFHTKLLGQKLILRQIEWGAQNGPITKNGVLPPTPLFFSKLNFSIRTSSQFNVPTTEMTLGIFFVSALVLFQDTFYDMFKEELETGANILKSIL